MRVLVLPDGDLSLILFISKKWLASQLRNLEADGFHLLFSSCFLVFIHIWELPDTITASRPIRDPETIISNGGAFILGFFSPGNSSNRYLGIWYNKKTEPVVWVANRNKPLKDAYGVVTISEDGNLVVLNGQNEVLWSSNVSNSGTNISAQLLDTGNLVLRDITTGSSIWESFQEPTDTFLPGMKLSSQIRTGPIVQLRSWKSLSDPSLGSFSLGIDPLNIPETIIWNDSRVYARSGPWNVHKETECDVYGWCGAFGSCNPDKKPICSCLRGFEPKTIQEWNRGNWTCGCVRKSPLQCERINQTGEVKKEDGFLKLETMKLPYFVEQSSVTVAECREQCLNNCSCIAYAYDAGIGCMTETQSLIDLQKFPSGGEDLYIRLAHSELGKFHDLLLILLLLC
ncbi:hypothetical protein LWI28_026341 [Acer negundo]|uniref:Uncharacterized protein n=1 Tax=Acer negundo TaxID=4023 RepID=A0AAD5P3X5_ACENE|nr:hypothetical protein LWI28_026341 [Acer negundo]